MNPQALMTLSRKIVAVITAHCLLGSQVVYAASAIVTDGRTATTVTQAGRVADVRTKTIVGRNAFNSFRHFNVNAGHTVNLHVPGAASNLLNLVHDSATHIHGTLNSLKNGEIGGNVYFANPHGFVVSNQGVVNVGSLHVSTPTTEFMQGFFDGKGLPSSDATAQLLDGAVPINADATIAIEGQINARHQVSLRGGAVYVDGGVHATSAGTPELPLAVNLDGVEHGVALVEKDGEIWIDAANDVEVRGELHADDAIAVTAEQDIVVEGQAHLSTADGGSVVVFADRNARLADFSVLDAGEGGFVEFSAINAVELAGGSLLAGDTGTVLIDPAQLIISTDMLRDDAPGSGSGISWSGASLALDASDKIVVDGAVVSTRKVAVTAGQTAVEAHRDNDSTGDSGNLTLTAPKIELKGGAALLAHATGPHASGDITIDADFNPTVPKDSSTASGVLGNILDSAFNLGADTPFGTFVDGLLDLPSTEIKISDSSIKGRDILLQAQGADRLGFDKSATAKITIDNSTLEGRNITAKAITDTSLLPAMTDPATGMDIEDLLSVAGGFIGFDATPFVSFSASQAAVKVDGSTVKASGNLTLESDATSKAKSLTSFYGVAVGFGYSDAEATTEVTGASTLEAGSKLRIAASTDSEMEVTANSSAVNKPIAVTYVKTDTLAKTRAATGNSVDIKADHLEVVADTTISVEASATAVERGASSAAAAISINDQVSETTAELGAINADARLLDVKANFEQDKNITYASAISNGSTGSFSTKLHNKINGFKQQAASNVLSRFTKHGDTLASFLFPGIKSGKLNLGAAIALADASNTLNANILSGAKVTSTDTIRIEALLQDDFNLGASGLAKSDGTGLGGAVALGDYNNLVQAYVGDGAEVEVNNKLFIDAGSTLAYPWAIAWDDVEDVLDHITGNIKDLLFTGHSFNSSKGKTGSVSGSVNVIDLSADANAYIAENAKINQGGARGDVSLKAHHDINIVQAVGSTVPFGLINKLLGKTPSNAGLGGAAGFVTLTSNAKAWVDDAVQLNANDLVINADSKQRIVQLARAGGKTDKMGLSGTLSRMTLSGNTWAGIESGAMVDTTGKVDLDAKHDSRELLIAGATMSGGNAGVGVSISFLDIAHNTDTFIEDRDKDGKSGGKVKSVGALTADAEQVSHIGSYSIASATASGSTGGSPTAQDSSKGKGKFGLAISGDASVNDINSNTRSTVDNGAKLEVGSLALTSKRNSSISTLSGTVAYAKGTGGGSSAGLAGSYSENALGGASEARVGSASVDTDGSITLDASSDGEVFSLAAGGSGGPSSGAKSFNVAGQVTRNTGNTTTRAALDGATINQNKTASTGAITLKANDSTDYATIAGAVALGGKAGVGAGVSVNDLANRAEAYLNNSEVYAAGALNINSMVSGQLRSMAAALTASSKFTISGSVAINEIDDVSLAYIDNTSSARPELTIKGDAIVNAGNGSTIETISGAAGASGQASLAGSVSVNRIGSQVSSYLRNATFDNNALDVSVTADSSNTIQALAGSIGASSKAGAGVGVAVNRIDSTTSAVVDGAATDLEVDSLKVQSTSESKIETVSVALGAGGAVGVGGSVSSNYLNSNTRAAIEGGARVLAQDDVGVIAQSDDSLQVAAGSAGIGVRAAGVGVSFSINRIASTTEATISGSSTRVTALAKDATGLAVANGKQTADVDLAKQVDIDTYGSLDLKSTRATKTVTGVAVNASSTQHVEAIGANVAGGKVAAGLVENVNTIAGSTQASVNQAKINTENTGADARQQVDITASNVAYANSFVGNLAAGVGAAGVGADIHGMARTTKAFTLGGEINARDQLVINSVALQGLSSMAIGGSVGGFGAAGTLGFGQFNNLTEASLDNTLVDAGSVDVVADNSNRMHIVAGTLTAGGGGVGGSFAVTVSNSTTRAYIQNLSAARRLQSGGAVNVEALNTTELDHTAVTASLSSGMFGVAGMASVNLVTDVTEAWVRNAQFGASTDKVGAVTVKADHQLAIDDKAGALGFSASSAGVGAGASVHIVKARTLATVDDSKIFSNASLNVHASSSNEINTIAMTAGVGASAGIGGSAAVVLIGDNMSEDANSELDAGNNGTLSKVDDFTRSDHLSDLSTTDDEVITADERTALNGDTQSQVKDVANGSDAAKKTFRTAATIEGDSQIIAGSVDLRAIDKSHAKTTVGGFGISAGLGAGAGVGVTQVKANVHAGTESTVTIDTTGAVNVTAAAQNVSGSKKAVEILALNGGAGLVGLGAAVATGEVDNQVSAELGGETTAVVGSINLRAEDSTEVDVEAYGAAVGAIGAGAVVARAEKSSTVTAQTLAGSKLKGASADVRALTQGQLKAKTLGAAGGLVAAGNGSDARVEETVTVSALSGDDSEFTLDNTLVVDASARPQLDASAEGYGGAGGLQVGVSIAKAVANSSVAAQLGKRNEVKAGSLTLQARQIRNGSADSAKSFARAAGGSLYGSVNATSSEAANDSVVLAGIGDDSNVETVGKTALKATTDNRQFAEVSGLSLALGAAVGSNNATATYDTEQRAGLASGVNLQAGSLDVEAGGTDRAHAKSVSGSGALLGSVLAAKASTNGKSVTEAYLNDGKAGRMLAAESVTLTADHTAEFDAYVDSTNAGLIGKSGANTSNNNTADVDVRIGDNLNLNAQAIDIVARNLVRKPQAGGSFNVFSKSGGFYDGPAANSRSDLYLDTDVKLGNSLIAVVLPEGDPHATGEGQQLNVVAKSDVVAGDTVKVDSGGAIANAKGQSEIHAHSLDARVDVAGGARIESVGDLNISSRSDADITANAFVDTYGLAGAGKGVTGTSAVTDESVSVKGGARLIARGEINLLAATDLAGLGVLDVESHTKVYNKTAFAFTGKPTADATADRTARIEIGSGALVGSGSHMTLQATQGHLYAFGRGKATDASREALESIAEAFGASEGALEISGGSSTNKGSGGITIDGDVRTGIYSKLALTFGKDFSPYYKKADGSKGKYIVGKEKGSDQWALFDPDTDTKVRDLVPDEQTDGITWTILTDQKISDNIRTEIERLKGIRSRYGVSDAQTKADLDTRIAILEAVLSTRNSGEYVDVIEVNPAYAATGDVNLWADWVVGSGGRIDAPGDAAINILSDSPMPLKVNSLTIPDDQGGRITFNNELVHSSTDIAARNRGTSAGVSLVMTDAASTPEPQITVDTRYSRLSGVYNPDSIPDMADPDLFLAGTLSNINGLVQVDNRWGSILSSADVRGDTVKISAGGDFVFDAGDTLYNIGPHPQSSGGFGSTALSYEGGSATSGSKATLSQQSDRGSQIFGNNVYLTADTININGMIQSGLPDKKITISQAEVDAAWAKSGSDRYVEIKYVGKSMVGDWAGGDDRRGVGNLVAELDRKTGKIRIIGTEVKGGTVLLSGRLASTGKGKVNVVDGFGRIEVVNTSNAPVSLTAVDTGGIEGQIILIDKAKSNGKGYALVTRYERLGNVIRVFDNQGLASSEATRLARAGGGRDTYYDPLANQRYFWMTGKQTTTQTIYKWYKENNSYLGFIPAEERSFSTSDYVAGYPKTKPITGGDLPQGDYVGVRTTSDDYTYARKTRVTSNEQIGKTIDRDGTNWYWGGFCDCIPKKKTWWSREETWEKGTDTYNYHSASADSRINIGFVGYDQGLVDVNSKGGIEIAGSFRNVGGNSNLVTSDGDIVSASLQGIRTGNLILTAPKGSVGSAGNYLRLTQQAGNLVNVNAGKDIFLQSTTGDLYINSLVTGGGDIGLLADRNLVAKSSGVIRGRSIRMEARNGTIGFGADKVKVDTDADAGGDLTVIAAKGDIRIEEVSGDLRVKRIATDGDVDLTVAGSVLDGNTEEVRDTTAIADLRRLWDDIGLTGTAAEDKRTQQVDTYENEQTALYFRYWRDERGLKTKPDGSVEHAAYDAGVTFTYSADEVAGLIDAGWSVADIEAREAAITARYRAFGLGAYDKNFRYTATAAEIADVTSGYKWTEKELANTIPTFVFKPLADTTTTIETANISANDVYVYAGGQIGAEIENLELLLDGSNILDDKTRLALAAAERDDVERVSGGPGGVDKLIIRQKEDLDIEASGAIVLDAKDHIFLGSEQDINVYAMQSVRDIRLKVQGGIHAVESIDVAGRTFGPGDKAADFVSQRLLLEASAGDIGSALRPIRILQQPGYPLTARASGSIWIHSLAGDLQIDSVFAEGDVELRSAGGMLDWANDQILDIQAANIALIAAGDIGAAGDRDAALEVELADDSGRVTLHGSGGANLFAPSLTTDLVLGEVMLGGGLRADSFSGLRVSEKLDAGDFVSLEALGGLVSEAAITAGDNVTLKAGADGMQLKSIVTAGNHLTATSAGAIGLNQLIASGHLDLHAATDILGDSLGAGVNLASKTMNLRADGGRVAGRSGFLSADSDGKVDIVAHDGVAFEERDGDLQSDIISTTNNSIDLLVSNGNAKLGRLLAPEMVRVVVNGDSLEIDDIADPREIVLKVLAEGSRAYVGRMGVAEQLFVNADNIELPNVEHTTTGELRVGLSGNDGGIADNLSITTHSRGSVLFDPFKVDNFDLTSNNDNLAFKQMLVGEIGRINTPTHKVVIDNANRFLYADVTTQLHSPNKPFNLKLTPERLLYTDTYVINYDPRYIVDSFSTENSLVRLDFKRDILPEILAQDLARDGGLVENMVLVDLLEANLATAAGGLVSSEGDLLGLSSADEEELVIVE